MQNSIIFGILLTILNKRIVKREYLAEKFEISMRTVMRYVDVLAESGVPIISLRGKNGGYSISDDFKIDKTFFTIEEMNRINNCLRATKTGFDDKLNDTILDKFINMQRLQADEKYFLKSSTLVIDAGTWTNPQKFRNKISVINRAIEESKCIDICYTDNKELKSSRTIEPYTLVLKEGVWYIYCWCRFRGDFRLFKLSRISSMNIAEQSFERRESDVYAKLNADFDASELIDIEFEFASTIYSEIEEWLGTESITERGTRFIANASIYAGNQLMQKLLSLGSSIKVIYPAALREELLVECMRTLKIYDYNK